MTECNTGFHARYQGSGCIGAGPSDTWIRTLECVCGVAGGGGVVVRETSLVAQWLRPCAPNAGEPGSIPGQGTRSHMLQLKILYVAAKT